MNLRTAARLGHALVLCACSLAFTGCARGKGIAAVEELCTHDGGMRIFETTHVTGYLTNDHEYFCGVCIELLGNRRFEYLDAYVMGNRADPGRYLRYSVGRQGDTACEDWASAPVDAKRLLREFNIGSGECIRVTALAERPSGVVLSQQWRSLVHDGVTIRLNEWRLMDESRDVLLAQIKDYQFTSKSTALLDMSGGGGNPDATCLQPNEYVAAVSQLKGKTGRILSDDSKRSAR